MCQAATILGKVLMFDCRIHVDPPSFPVNVVLAVWSCSAVSFVWWCFAHLHPVHLLTPDRYSHVCLWRDFVVWFCPLLSKTCDQVPLFTRAFREISILCIIFCQYYVTINASTFLEFSHLFQVGNLSFFLFYNFKLLSVSLN